MYIVNLIDYRLHIIQWLSYEIMLSLINDYTLFVNSILAQVMMQTFVVANSPILKLNRDNIETNVI